MWPLEIEVTVTSPCTSYFAGLGASEGWWTKLFEEDVLPTQVGEGEVLLLSGYEFEPEEQDDEDA